MLILPKTIHIYVHARCSAVCVFCVRVPAFVCRLCKLRAKVCVCVPENGNYINEAFAA